MKTVIEMARAAGFPKWDDHEPVTVDMYARFADLVRTDEREAIAQSLDKQADLACDEIDRQWAQEMAAAVRARGEKT